MSNTKRNTKEIETISYDIKMFERFVQRNLNTSNINYKVYHLLCKPKIYINAYGNICKNKGSTTLGIKEDEGFLQSFGLERPKTIAQAFKKKQYKWQALRRTMIPKPGSKKMRPIDTPTQRDRIVQEAIRCILEAIFEPEFQEFEKATGNLASNYGFRPNKSCHTAVKQLKLKGTPTNIAIEGNIKGAYNNVNRKILLDLISVRIKDKDFIEVIKNLLNTGIMERRRYMHTLTGTPLTKPAGLVKGGIVSPLLFNIYMFPLDKFIFKDIEQRTSANTRIKNKHNLDYTRTQERMKTLRQEIAILEKNSKQRKNLLLRLRTERDKLLTTPSIDLQQKNVGAVYARYADDWVYFIQGNVKDAQKMKEKINEFTVRELKLELDLEKTLISKLENGVSFLGFEIMRWSKKQTKIRKKTSERKLTTRIGPITVFVPTNKRVSTRGLNILPCKKRLIKSLQAKKMIDLSKRKAIAIRGLIQYTPFEIVMHFENIATGLALYYNQCDSVGRLHYTLYLLQYSCACTLAARSKSTLAKTINKFGIRSTMNQEFISSKGTYDRTVRVPSLADFRKEGFFDPKYRENTINYFDPFKFKLNQRTKLKIFVECCRCGSDENVEMHHLGSVKSIPKSKQGYSKDFNAPIRNRLQMPLCKKCHDMITFGKYDQDSLKDYHNRYIAML